MMMCDEDNRTMQQSANQAEATCTYHPHRSNYSGSFTITLTFLNPPMAGAQACFARKDGTTPTFRHVDLRCSSGIELGCSELRKIRDWDVKDMIENLF